MLTLYGSNGSGSAAVEIALALCKLDYRVERASTWEADSAQAALQQANPLGQIPALVMDDGSVMTESAAILIDLGLRHPASGLLPAEPHARAQAVRGLVLLAANCYAAIGVIDYPERWCSGGDKAQHDSIRAGTRGRLHRCWEIFADLFRTEWGGAPHLCGSNANALDFLAAVISRWGGAREHLRAVRPGLAAALQRAEAHPDAAPVFARHWPDAPRPTAA